MRALALYRLFTTLEKAREHGAHAKEGQSQNAQSLRGALRGCRKTMPRMRGIGDGEAHSRSPGAPAITPGGAMARHGANIDHKARKSVQVLPLLLPDAATVGHQESAGMPKAASTHIGVLLGGAPAGGPQARRRRRAGSSLKWGPPAVGGRWPHS